MKSMTGFASLEKETKSAHISIDIKGYNSRYLDIYITLPPECAAFEVEIRRIVSKRCFRGKIELAVRLQKKEPLPLRLNNAALKTYLSICAELIPRAAAEGIKIEDKIRAADILRFEGVIEAERVCADDVLRDDIIDLVSAVLERFNSEREREGAHTKKHILSLIDQIENAKNEIAASAPFVEEQIKTNIEKRFKELKIDGIDENRLLAEIAFLLMKCTIAEELSRLESHILEFRAYTSQAGGVTGPGKKLDFLCQEIAREINTIGSKTPLCSVSRLVVPMKESVENIREQLRNIE